MQKLWLAAVLAMTAQTPEAATAGLNTTVGAATQSVNFLNPGYCNNTSNQFNAASLPMNSQSCSANLGAATLTADAEGWIVYGMMGAKVNVSATGTDASLMGGVFATASSIFSDDPFLDVAGLSQDDPVTMTISYTVTGSKSASFSGNFSGASEPNNIQQWLVLMLGQDGGPNISQQAFSNFNPGVFDVSYTLLNQRPFFIAGSLYVQYQFPNLPPGAGAFNAAASFDYSGTVQMTQIVVANGPTNYTNFSMTGGTAGTNYLNVLTAPHPFASVPEPSTGILLGEALAFGGLVGVWRRRGGRRQTGTL
jgi:hypothetical protein